jgi:hypothetical protein
MSEVLAFTLGVVGGTEASPEQVALNVTRWRNEQAKRALLREQAASEGITISEVKARHRQNDKTRSKEFREARRLKLSGNFTAMVAEVVAQHKVIA